ncbi:MAG: hypothetical protein OEW42_03965 [Acidimicrobiia bacterium]|nr:hypothetical protein [Acidimicrobiia bacterium]MDH5236862.1 hypothetical protein [Acidimicrobiia bacterium]
MEPTSPEDRKNQRDAVWEITIRVMVIGVPMAVIAVLLRALGVPWWLIGIAYAAFVWYLVAEA